MIYSKPFIYTFIHILSGFIGAFYPAFLGIFIVYQLLQLIFGVRIFVFQMDYKNGNTWQHTALKLAEIGLGYFIGVNFRRYYNL